MVCSAAGPAQRELQLVRRFSGGPPAPLRGEAPRHEAALAAGWDARKLPFARYSLGRPGIAAWDSPPHHEGPKCAHPPVETRVVGAPSQTRSTKSCRAAALAFTGEETCTSFPRLVAQSHQAGPRQAGGCAALCAAGGSLDRHSACAGREPSRAKQQASEEAERGKREAPFGIRRLPGHLWRKRPACQAPPARVRPGKGFRRVGSGEIREAAPCQASKPGRGGDLMPIAHSHLWTAGCRGRGRVEANFHFGESRTRL